jgi:RIO kinase 1
VQPTTSPSGVALDWPHGEPYEDVPLGTLKSGKEAEIFLVERRFASGPRLIAHKRYRPRYPQKGQLRAEGFANSTAYRGDAVYKASWFLPTRDKKAVMGGSRGLMMEFIGDETNAAPKLAQARLSPAELASAWQQLLDSLHALTAAGMVHADLSAYNLLWWEGRLVVIDLPQAVEFITNSDAYDLLHRDLSNVADWFTRHGLPVDVEAVYAELVALAW